MQTSITSNQFGFQAPIIKPVSLIDNQETVLTAVNNLVEESNINEPLSNSIQTITENKENKKMKQLSTKSATKAKKGKQSAHYRKGHFRGTATGKTVWVQGKIIHETEYYKVKTQSPTQYYNAMTGSNVRIETLFSYTGGKAKFYKRTQFLWNEMIDQKRVKKIVIPFLGGGSDFLSIAVKAIEAGVKTAIVNDFNPVIANVFTHMKENREALKAEVVSISNIGFESTEEKKLFLQILAEEANAIEMRGEYTSLRLASLALILLNNSHKGIYKFDGTRSRYTFGMHNNQKDLKNLAETYISKIDFYGYFIDQFEDFSVYNCSYDDLIRRYDRENTLIVADPLYVEEKHDEPTDMVLRGCSVDYGFDDFDHHGCFEVFSNLKSQLIYHNSYNTVLINKFKSCSFKDFMIVEKHSISRDENNKQKKSFEVIFYTDKRTFTPFQEQADSTVTVTNAINSIDYRPLVIVAA